MSANSEARIQMNSLNTPRIKDSLATEDREFYERELASFVPDHVFDAHCHLYHPDQGKWSGLGFAKSIGYREHQRLAKQLYPGRLLADLFIHSVWEKTEVANEWLAEQVRQHPTGRGLFLAKPTDDPEWVRQEVRRLGMHGLKCYHVFAQTEPTWEADIPDYLPERLVRVADKEGWAITLHVVKSRALADPSNIHWIRHYCQTYPRMKLILAHSARGFQPAHNLEGLPKLTGLDNLYFDTSANCEPIAHQAILRIIGHERLLYGTDFPVSLLRGRSVAVADTFLWLYGDTPVWNEKHKTIRPTLVGHEHLRSLKWACWSEKLSDKKVEDVFWNNAARLFNVH